MTCGPIDYPDYASEADVTYPTGTILSGYPRSPGRMPDVIECPSAGATVTGAGVYPATQGVRDLFQLRPYRYTMPKVQAAQHAPPRRPTRPH